MTVIVNNNFKHVAQKTTNDAEGIRQLVNAANNALDGKTNNTGIATLDTSTTTTKVTNNRCLLGSVVVLQPLTANAADAVPTTFIVTSSGFFTLSHSSNSQTDRSFKYAIIG